MEIKENSSKLVKPSTPTPTALRNYNISFFDEKQTNSWVPLILYYSSSKTYTQTALNRILETSLSNTLTDFYPLAGRYTTHASFIDCSDQGALYVQAKANFPLSRFLSLQWELKVDMLADFLKCDVCQVCGTDDPLLVVKVTNLECGGVVIGMSFAHKFGDMGTFCTFFNNWAARSRELVMGVKLDLATYSPVFSLSHRFPTTGRRKDEAMVTSLGVNCPLRVFTFKGVAINKLREKIMCEENVTQRPSKVQLIMALLLKALMDIDKVNGQPKITVACQAVNLRNKVIPKIGDNVCGNFYAIALARVECGRGENINIGIRDLLEVLYESVCEITSNYAKALVQSGKDYDYEALSKPFSEIDKTLTNNDVNYMFTSWSKFSFYTVDFGWGKPVWRSIPNYTTPNVVVIMDDEEGDGLEAWVHLEENRMCALEQHPSIQAYII